MGHAIASSRQRLFTPCSLDVFFYALYEIGHAIAHSWAKFHQVTKAGNKLY